MQCNFWFDVNKQRSANCIYTASNDYIYTSLHRRRMSNGKEQETLAGIEEVKKICRLRAMDLVKVAPQVSRL